MTYVVSSQFCTLPKALIWLWDVLCRALGTRLPVVTCLPYTLNASDLARSLRGGLEGNQDWGPVIYYQEYHFDYSEYFQSLKS